jgi:hypothetical protein
MDVVFAKEYMPQSVGLSVNAQLPPGIKIEQVMQVASLFPPAGAGTPAIYRWKFQKVMRAGRR